MSGANGTRELNARSGNQAMGGSHEIRPVVHYGHISHSNNLFAPLSIFHDDML